LLLAGVLDELELRSGDVFANHQEYLTVFTASGLERSSNSSKTPVSSNLGEQYQML
jgi:hypothetical protein